MNTNTSEHDEQVGVPFWRRGDISQADLMNLQAELLRLRREATEYTVLIGEQGRALEGLRRKLDGYQVLIAHHKEHHELEGGKE